MKDTKRKKIGKQRQDNESQEKKMQKMKIQEK